MRARQTIVCGFIMLYLGERRRPPQFMTFFWRWQVGLPLLRYALGCFWSVSQVVLKIKELFDLLRIQA